MDQQADRGSDTQTDGVRDGVADMEGLHLEGSDPEGFSGLYRAQFSFAGKAITCQFNLDQSPGQGCGVDRCRDLCQQVLDGTDMVLMSMSDDDPLDLIGVVA